MDINSKYKLNCKLVTDGGAKLSIYKSTTSGMKICYAEVNGPVVAGYLCLATEAHDDFGLPHTLEHLVFLGSEKYPYKGVLDLIANRCLAQGTNAWTDTDHTCYTMNTAGAEGFLKLLPIYIDHLLHPVLSDAAFTTEVHHINGEGEDAGVVYCEMQARENSGESRCHLAMLRSMYSGNCGYKSETGGLMKCLRESTTNEKVRAYHKKFYIPENLSVIIVGQIDITKVFQALEPVEERIAQDVRERTFIKPWQNDVPLLEKSVTLNVEYPCDEDEYGLAIAAWRGPIAKDYSRLISVQILMDYLTDTSVSPLNREFVEIDEPICNQVDYTVIENSVSCIYLHFSNVPTKKLSEVQENLFKVLKNISDGTEEIDMNRMRALIKKKKLFILRQMENNPHDQLAGCLIGDFLYGASFQDLQHRVQEIPAIEKLLKFDAGFWTHLLTTYMINGNYVIVLGTPSPSLAAKMAKQEKSRIEEQKKQLGPTGLKEKAIILKEAMQANEVPPPNELIKSVSVPSVKSIKFHPVKRSCNVLESEDDVEYPVKKMPCRFQLDVMKTNFVRLYILMDTSELPLDLRMYLPLFIELLNESAIKRNGEIIPYQDVVKQLAEDTISMSASLGLNYSRFFCTKYAQVICCELMVEEEKYEKSVQWTREILYQIVFEPSRIKSSVNKMITDVATIKRSGSSVAKTMMKNLCFSPESNHWTASMLRQCTFLSRILEKLDKDPDDVVAKLNEVRDIVTKPERMIIHLALNLENMKKMLEPEKVWIKDFLPSTVAPGKMKIPFKKCYEFLEPMNGEATKGMITGVGSVASSFLIQCAPCIKSCTHPDYAALLVLIQYLTQTEGPMWQQIRGLGLSYNYSIHVDPDTGLIYFLLHKSGHLVKAYKEAVNIVESHLSGETKWKTELIESGASSLVFDLIEKVKTVADVAEESLKAYCSDVKMDFTQTLVEKVLKITPADMERVGKMYLQPLFNPEESRCTVCCHPNKVNEIVSGFQELSRELTVVPSLEDSFMAKF